MRNITKGANSRPQNSTSNSGKSRRSYNGNSRTKGGMRTTPSPRQTGGSVRSNCEHSNRRTDCPRSERHANVGRTRSDEWPGWVTRYQSVFAVSRSDAARMLEISYPSMAISPVDVTDLLIMLDCWIAVIVDLMAVDSAQPIVRAIVETGVQTGISNLIKSADVSASNLIAQGWNANCCAYPFDAIQDRWLSVSNRPTQELWRLLQTLRFPKRFSPDIAKRYKEEETLREYLSLDNSVYQKDQSHRRAIACDDVQTGRYTHDVIRIKEPYGYIGMRLKQVIADLLVGYSKIFDHAENYDQAMSRLNRQGIELKIPTGSTADCGMNFRKKARKLLSTVGVSSIPDDEPDAFASVVLCVNKNYKTPRTIAKEPFKRAILQKIVRNELISTLSRNNIRTKGLDGKSGTFPVFHFEDQSLNRAWCYSLEAATLDASNASDSISWDLVKYLFPPHVVSDLEYVRSDKISISGRVKTINKAFTSGAGCCFEVESIFFGAILLLALELNDMRVPSRRHVRQGRVDYYNAIATVYGDDMIISTHAAQTAIELLTLFGITVNADKSHYLDDDPYRETCGIEVYDGHDVSSIYYPRKTVLEIEHGFNRRIELDRTVNILAKMQQRLYKAQYHHACMVISSIVRSLKPSIRIGSTSIVHDGLIADYVLPAVPQWYFSKPERALLPEQLREHLTEITVATREPVSIDTLDDDTNYYLWLYHRRFHPDPDKLLFVDPDGSTTYLDVLGTEETAVALLENSNGRDNGNFKLKLTNRVVTF